MRRYDRDRSTVPSRTGCSLRGQMTGEHLPFRRDMRITFADHFQVGRWPLSGLGTGIQKKLLYIRLNNSQASETKKDRAYCRTTGWLGELHGLMN